MPLTQNIGLEQLSQYFHLPIQAVAKELGVCATVLKKICRRNGIPRWPHRKIKSLDKMIASLQAISPKSPEDEDRIKQEIAALMSKKRYLISNPNSLGTGPHVKIKKNTPLSSAKSKRKPASVSTQQETHPSTGETGEETELSSTFLDPDILDWEGLTSWQEPHFSESELGSVPYDSPLGRALLMKPYPLDQLPKLLSPVHMPSMATSRSLPHMAMPSGGASTFHSYSSSSSSRGSAFSAKLPDIGSVAEPIGISQPIERDHSSIGAPVSVAKLDVLEPNLLLPSVNPLPFTTQYGIHPIAQTLPHHISSTEWRDSLPPWYSDEYQEFALSSRLVGLPADFATPSCLRGEDGQLPLDLPPHAPGDVHGPSVPDVVSQASAVPHHDTDDNVPQPEPSDADESGQSFIVAGNDAPGLSVSNSVDSAEPTLFDLL